MKNSLHLEGAASEPIWLMADGEEPHVIGIRLDCGDAGVVYVTREQAADLAQQLSHLLNQLGGAQGSSVSATKVTYKGSFDRIRHAILQMVDAPENNLEHEEYAALAVEAQDLSDYLGSISESLAMAASPECTEALASLLGEFLKLHAGRGSRAGTGEKEGRK